MNTNTFYRGLKVPKSEIDDVAKYAPSLRYVLYIDCRIQ